MEPKNNKKNKCALKFCAQVIIDKDGRGHSCGYCSLRYCSCCCMSRAQSCQKQLPNKHSHQPSHDNSFDEKGKNQSQPDFTQNKKNISNSDKITINKLLQYFQENNIEQISLTTEGNLEIKYNSTKNTRNSDKPKNIVIISEQEINSKELKEVKNFYQKNNKTSLSQQELNNLFSFSIKTTQEAPRDSKAV